MKTISLQEAADRLGVHYMTVYRYVRLGRLPARKVAGEWQVDVADLEGLRRGHDRTVRTRRPAEWAKRLEARLVDGDEPGAWGVVEAALTSGSTPSDIYTKLLAPALRSVGRQWESGDLTVAQEHVASAVASRVIGRLGPRFARRGRPRGRVIVTTPPGERHTIPSAIVADLLRGAGFEVLDLGADMPAESLAETVGSTADALAVCVSSTNSGSDRTIRRAIRAIRKAGDAPIFLGGAAVEDEEHAIRLGADGWAADGPGAVDLVAALVAGEARRETEER